MSDVQRIPIISKEQWLDLRMQDITATDVPAIVGEGMFDSAAGVWAKKKGFVEPAAETSAMRRGRWAEPAVFEALADTYPTWDLRRLKVYLRDTAARLGATPDGFAVIPGHDGITYVEAKVVMRPVFVRDWCGGCDDNEAPVDAPMGYKLQTLTGSMLYDAPRALIAALVHDTYDWQLRIVEVPRHSGAEKVIRERVAAFWRDYLDANVCPPLDPARDHDLVKELYPRDDGTEIDLRDDDNMLALVNWRDAMKDSIKRLEKGLDSVETGIKKRLGRATYGRLGDGRTISWKTIKFSGYQVPARESRRLQVSKR